MRKRSLPADAGRPAGGRGPRSPAWPQAPARALPPEAQMCATQTQDLADERIAACTGLLKSRRLSGEPKGVAYALRGLAYLDRGDIPHAIGDLDQAVTLAPDFAPAYQNRGNAWYARGNYGKALADYDAAIALDPDTASPYVNRGTVRRDLGYMSGALADFDKAIGLDPRPRARLPGARRALSAPARLCATPSPISTAPSRLAPERRQLHAAGARRMKAPANTTRRWPITARPRGSIRQRIDALTAQGGVWRKKGDFDKAIAVYDRALALDRQAAGHLQIARGSLCRQGRPQARHGRHRPRAQVHLEGGPAQGARRTAARRWRHRRRRARRRRHAQAAARQRPCHGAARRSACAQEGLCRARLPHLDKSIEANGHDALALGVRGEVYFAKGDSERALIDLNRAIALGTISAGALSHARHDLREERRHRERARRPRHGDHGATRARPASISSAAGLAPRQGRHGAGARRSQRGPGARAGQSRRR